MFLSLKTVMVTSVAVGGLATGVAGASPPRGSDVVQSVTAAAAEEAQLHATITGLKGTERQLEAVLADHLNPQTSPLSGMLAAPASPVTPETPVSAAPIPAAGVPSGAAPVVPSPGPTYDTGGQDADGGTSGSPTTTEPHAPTMTTEPTTSVPSTTTTTTSTTQPYPTTTTTRPRYDGGND